MGIGQTIEKNLNETKRKLEKVVKTASDRIKKAPVGSVRAVKHGKGMQYYHRKDPKEKSGVYIPAAEKDLAMKLLQKKYDKKVLTDAGKQIRVIERFLEEYEPELLKRIYEEFREARKDLPEPFEVSDEEYANAWQNIQYQAKGFKEDAPVHYTTKGERVRSKSEVLIANALNDAGIPYRYECPLQIGNTLIYPDFTLLRIRDRQEIYCEHLGMLDDMTYVNNALLRIRLYEENGIFPGERLILLAETQMQPLNLLTVNRMIRHFSESS